MVQEQIEITPKQEQEMTVLESIGMFLMSYGIITLGYEIASWKGWIAGFCLAMGIAILYNLCQPKDGEK